VAHPIYLLSFEVPTVRTLSLFLTGIRQFFDIPQICELNNAPALEQAMVKVVKWIIPVS
jgi:hypothetical protein